MKNSRHKIILLAGLLFALVTLPACRAHAEDEEVLAVYYGNSPCGDFLKRVLGIEKNSSCDRIKWELHLYTDAKTKQPSQYKLSYTYGNQANGPGFVNGGTSKEITGKWSFGKGMKVNPETPVYILNPEQSEKSLFFARMGEHLIHLLYTDKTLMIGDASWSYTLNKKNQSKE